MYLIGYDISNPKRLAKVYKTLLDYAVPIQYSVFLFEGSKNHLQSCIERLLEIIHTKEDDLRIYQLPTNGKQWRLGKSFLPEGIFLTGMPMGIY
ncbi:CRISPR-associated endonuclease Cas2 [Conservatibacter flavescens]|nr:CRISPR-associated endonuclease Cas2 [Conservatibacter flavescens]